MWYTEKCLQLWIVQHNPRDGKMIIFSIGIVKASTAMINLIKTETDAPVLSSISRSWNSGSRCSTSPNEHFIFFLQPSGTRIRNASWAFGLLHWKVVFLLIWQHQLMCCHFLLLCSVKPLCCKIQIKYLNHWYSNLFTECVNDQLHWLSS